MDDAAPPLLHGASRPAAAHAPVRLEALDGLRGVAAFAVVLLHGTRIFELSWTPHHAYLAVDFFFLLSGYVLARAFDERLAAGGAWPFLRNRVIRLYPLILVGSLLGTVVIAARGVMSGSIDLRVPLTDFLSSLLLSPTPPIAAPQWRFYHPDPVLWSLFFEMAANIVYAFAAPWLKGARLWALVAAGGAGLVVCVVREGDADFGLVNFPLGAFRVLFAFFLGVALQRRLDRRKIAFSLPPIAHLFSFAALTLILLSPLPASAAYDLAAILILFPALLLAALATRPAVGWSGIFVMAGLLSYPVYVIHHPAFRAIANAVSRLGASEAQRAAAFGTSLAAVTFAAWLLARFYDEPVRRWLLARATTSRRAPWPLGAREPRRT